jgi:hypothetical protein
MPRKFLPSTWLLLIALGGCAAPNPHTHGGQLVCEHKCDDKPEATTAPYKATYVLHQWRTPSPDQPTPHTWIAEEQVTELYIRGLEKGDALGFEKDDKGQWFAVAGCEKIPLEPGRYCWHISQATEYRGFHLAVHEVCEAFKETVAMIIGLPAGIVLLVLLAPFFVLCLPFYLFCVCL